GKLNLLSHQRRVRRRRKGTQAAVRSLQVEQQADVILAAERGRVGERYILGHAEGNWTLRQTLQVLSELTGLPAPRWRIPWWVAFLVACAEEVRSRFTGQPPRAPLAGVRMARYKMFFNPAKAIRELGLPQTPPREAFAEAIDWFRAHGYVQAP
ncbi:MAG: hypothetical protein N2438_08800, partial [Limisphaera sp.]|nr:hypothetical protein [Limisphaera sp.]